jgi:hypothetical protein
MSPERRLISQAVKLPHGNARGIRPTDPTYRMTAIVLPLLQGPGKVTECPVWRSWWLPSRNSTELRDRLRWRALRNLAIGALRRTGAVNIAAALRHAGRDPTRPVTIPAAP